MKYLTFRQIQDLINKVLANNQLKEALSISIEAHLIENDILKPRFGAAIYQKEKTATGGPIFHHIICEDIESLKFKFQNSINEKQKK